MVTFSRNNPSIVVCNSVVRKIWVFFHFMLGKSKSLLLEKVSVKVKNIYWASTCAQSQQFWSKNLLIIFSFLSWKLIRLSLQTIQQWERRHWERISFTTSCTHFGARSSSWKSFPTSQSLSSTPSSWSRSANRLNFEVFFNVQGKSSKLLTKNLETMRTLSFQPKREEVIPGIRKGTFFLGLFGVTLLDLWGHE